jgi:hypothetical protein
MNMRDSEFDEENLHEKKYEKNCSKSYENDHDTNMSINFVEFDDQKNELYYEKITVNSKKKYETFAEFVEIEIFCIICKKIFSFRNKLHNHLKSNCKLVTKSTTANTFETIIISTDLNKNDNRNSIIKKFIIVK